MILVSKKDAGKALNEDESANPAGLIHFSKKVISTALHLKL